MCANGLTRSGAVELRVSLRPVLSQWPDPELNCTAPGIQKQLSTTSLSRLESGEIIEEASTSRMLESPVKKAKLSIPAVAMICVRTLIGMKLPRSGRTRGDATRFVPGQNQRSEHRT